MNKVIGAAGAAIVLAAGAAAADEATKSSVRVDTDKAAVTLYLPPVEGTRAERVMWLCEELGVPYAVVTPPGDFLTASKAMKQINSMGTLPTVRVGDTTIVESGAILQLIELKLAKGGTTPASDSPDLPYHLQWLHYAEGSAMTRISTEYLLKAVKGQPEHTPQTQRHLQGTQRVLAYMEEHLGKYPYFGGRAFTSADIMMHFPIKQSVFLNKADMTQYPNILAWRERVQSRPAFKRAKVQPEVIPPKMPG
jgi:glutathione S-transferase